MMSTSETVDQPILSASGMNTTGNNLHNKIYHMQQFILNHKKVQLFLREAISRIISIKNGIIIYFNLLLTNEVKAIVKRLIKYRRLDSTFFLEILVKLKDS